MKELTVEDVYDDANMKSKTGAIEIMKHIYPSRKPLNQASISEFVELPRQVFQSEIKPKQEREQYIEASRNFTNVPSGSLTLPEKYPKKRCNSSMGQASTAAS